MSRTPEQRAIVRDSLGVGIATGLYGVSFGAISVASGLSVAQTCALSLLVFTGASQFALVGVLSGGGSGFAAAATALLLGTRNTLYGLRVASLLGVRGPARLGAAHLLLDESTAMSVTRESQEDARLGFVVTGGTIFVLWNLFTLLGAVGGNAVGDPRTYGLDAAVGAAFLALLWPQLAEPSHRVVAVLAVAVALGLVPVAPVGVPVLAAGGVALLVGLLPQEVVVTWATILVAGVGCYLLKLSGLSVPPSILERPVVRRITGLIPVALLSALVAVQVFSTGHRLVLDERAAGLAMAVVLLLARAPFLVVVCGAALTAGLLRLL